MKYDKHCKPKKVLTDFQADKRHEKIARRAYQRQLNHAVDIYKDGLIRFRTKIAHNDYSEGLWLRIITFLRIFIFAYLKR